MTSTLTPLQLYDLYKSWTRQDSRIWTFRISDLAHVAVEYLGQLPNPSEGALGPWQPMLFEFPQADPVWFGRHFMSLAAAKTNALKSAQASGHSIPVPTHQQSN